MTNIAGISACNNTGCNDQFINVSSQSSFFTERSADYTPPENYELEILKMVGHCENTWDLTTDAAPTQASCDDNAYTEYEMGQSVFYTIWYNNG